MKNAYRLWLPGFVIGFLILASGVAKAEDLVTLLRKNSDPQTFDINTIDENFQGLSISSGQRVLIDRQRIAEAIAAARTAMKDYKLKSLKIISKTEAAPFITVVYETENEFTLGNATMSEKIISHEIYEVKGDSYKLLYGAQTETLLKSL